MNTGKWKLAPRWRIAIPFVAIAVLALVVPASRLSAQTISEPTNAAPLLPDEEPPSEPWSPPGLAPAASEELPSPVTEESELSLEGTEDWVLEDKVEAVAVPTWYQPTHWFGLSPWDTGIELGINGSSGTNDSFSLRTGGYVKRKSRYSKLDFNLYYNRTANGGVITQDNAKMDFRNDWLLDEASPWTLFGKGTLFYDHFQVYDLQTNANTGVGYQFVKEPDIEMTGRLGGGASREFGGPDEEWVAEALFGFEYEQQLTPTQKVGCKSDYYPEFENFGRYRLVTEASWEIELDKPSNISLKLSATDRYDSTPNGSEPHLVNYSVLLLLKL